MNIKTLKVSIFNKTIKNIYKKAPLNYFVAYGYENENENLKSTCQKTKQQAINQFNKLNIYHDGYVLNNNN